MNIEIKNIKFFDQMSEETNAFHASIYIDGKRVGEAKNDGKGGMTDYRAIHHDYLPLIKEAEEYCIQLPPLKFSDGGTLPMDFELYIDTEVENFIKNRETAKMQKKILKYQEDHIVFGTELSFRMAYWTMASKRRAPISFMLEKHPDAVKSKLAEIKAQLKLGERILNTNLPKELL